MREVNHGGQNHPLFRPYFIGRLVAFGVGAFGGTWRIGTLDSETTVSVTSPLRIGLWDLFQEGLESWSNKWG